MSMQTSSGNKALTIHTPEKFDFQFHTEFKKQYEAENTSRDIVLDMQRTQYMDSSALGMMLQLKEYAEKNNYKINVKNPSENIKQIMQIAHFDKMFNIS